MKATSRSEAKSLGLTRYSNGKVCPRGHVSERMTSNARCCTCLNDDKIKYRKENPEKTKEYMRKWHALNVEHSRKYREINKEKLARRSYEWTSRNKDRVAENNREWLKKNRHRALANARRWRLDNPERYAEARKQARVRRREHFRTYSLNALALRRGAGGSIERVAIDRMMLEQKGLCNYCFSDITEVFDIDHIFPISKGGKNEEDNLQLLCPSCNRSKGAKTEAEYLAWKKEKESVAS